MIKTLHDYPALFAFLGLPLGFAVFKTIWNVCQIDDPSDAGVTGTIRTLTDRSTKWDSRVFSFLSLLPFVSMFLTFHLMKRKIPGLASLILWEGRMEPDTREKAFNALSQLAQTRRGVSQMTAIEALAHLAHGTNLRNLLLRPHDVEGLLHLYSWYK